MLFYYKNYSWQDIMKKKKTSAISFFFVFECKIALISITVQEKFWESHGAPIFLKCQKHLLPMFCHFKIHCDTNI